MVWGPSRNLPVLFKCGVLSDQLCRWQKLISAVILHCTSYPHQDVGALSTWEILSIFAYSVVIIYFRLYCYGDIYTMIPLEGREGGKINHEEDSYFVLTVSTFTYYALGSALSYGLGTEQIPPRTFKLLLRFVKKGPKSTPPSRLSDSWHLVFKLINTKQ